MNERKALEKGQYILLSAKDNTLCPKKFRIENVINSGSTVICYEASNEEGCCGVLKEFYPKTAYGLERDFRGQLIHSDEYRASFRRFAEAEKEYISAYEMLAHERENGEYPELKTFIPYFEIYCGCDENGTKAGSTYIWTPNRQVETFDILCRDIQACPHKEPEKKLILVLSAVKTLTQCICFLHSAGMIHRDIKPSNFGFVRQKNKPLISSISIVDVDSICSVYSCPERTVFTKGYDEPEIDEELPCNQTVIYSIGATLFHAVINTPETCKNGFVFRHEFYDGIQDMVGRSELVRASKINSNPYVTHMLTVILKKSLCRREYRYPNCEELLKDLNSILSFLLK